VCTRHVSSRWAIRRPFFPGLFRGLCQERGAAQGRLHSRPRKCRIRSRVSA
jgi:hypothetical protein